LKKILYLGFGLKQKQIQLLEKDVQNLNPTMHLRWTVPSPT